MRKICSFWLSLALILTSVSLGAFPVTAADVVDLTSYVKVIQFETPVEFSDVNGDHVGLCVSFSNAGVNLIREFFEYSYQGSNPYQTPDYGYMTVVIDGIEHKVTQYANSGDWFRLNVDGAGLFAGTQYTVCLRVYNWNDALSAQTNDFKVVCNYQSAGLTDTRIPLCEDIETSALNRLFIDYVDAMDISLWGDGSPYNLIDGDVGVPTTSGADRDGYLQGSKLGGNVYDNQCEVYFFNSEKDLCVEYYTLYTGGDTAKWPMRNPLGWVLYGSNYGFYEEDEWVVVDTVMPDSEYSTGMEDVSATPYTYKVDHPGVYACYKFVFTTRSEQFQLNELEIYGSDAINMGADGMWLDTLNEFTVGNGVGVHYEFIGSNLDWNGICYRLNGESPYGDGLVAQVRITGGKYTEPTTFAISDYHYTEMYGQHTISFDLESVGVEIGEGYEYEIITTLVSAETGKTEYILSSNRVREIATVATAGAANRPSDCVSGNEAYAVLEKYGDLTPYFMEDSLWSMYGTWAGEEVENLFDGDDSTKMANNYNHNSIEWSYSSPVVVRSYGMISGNDVNRFPARNPREWYLLGSNDGEEWYVLDYVDRALFTNDNGAMYAREIDNEDAYYYYSLEVYSSGQFELGEVILRGEVGELPEAPDEQLQWVVADDLKLEYVSEFWTGNGVGVVYHPTPSDAAARAAWQAMALGEVYPIVIVEGGIYDEPTTFVITETAHDQYFDGFAFRFDVESAGMEIGAGFEYTITTQLVDAQGNVRFVFTDIEDTVTAGVSTDGAVNRPSDCLTGEDVRNLLEHRKDFADEFDPYGSYTNGWTWNGEGVENLFDGDWQTKMAGGFTDASIFWSYNSPVCIGAYVLVTGNDSAEFWGRNPVEWTLYGSHDGEDWAVVDEVSWAGFAASNCEPYGRIVENGQEYVYYRLSVRSRDQFQLGEIILLGEEESAEPPAEKLQGDANGDGVVNMRDVATIAQYLAGLEVELDAEAADVTGEGYINSKDITRLREYLSGIDVELN